MVGEKWILKFLVYADRLCSKATVRGNATILRFMISGMPWTYIHTHTHTNTHTHTHTMSTNDVQTFHLELLKYVKVQSINRNHLKKSA